MEPFTHLLASYTLARAARAPVISLRMAVFLCAGLAPDLDWFFHLPPPLTELRAYGTATHSLAGAAALAVAIGAAGWAAARRLGRERMSVGASLACAFAAVAVHLLLDLCSNLGVALFWPWRSARVAWNLVGGFDAVALVVLAACALLPALLSLVSEEIGAGAEALAARPWPAGAAWPLAALLLLTAYLGGRGLLHSRAEELLGGAQYQGSAPLHWAAYPQGAFSFAWRGVVETDTFLAEVEVPVAGGTAFHPRRAAIRFKPEPSAALDAAAASPLARAYTAVARFPAASLETTAEGARAELRELGDSPLRSAAGTWLALIDLDAQSHVLHQELRYAPSRNP